MPAPEIAKRVTLIENGRIYDHEGDVDQPLVRDILIVDGVIAAVAAMMPYLPEAHRRTWVTDIGINRHVAG
jgi:hypothetical protein